MADLFKDILPSLMVHNTKTEFDPKEYVPFVINKALSFHYDCILQANEMNRLPGKDKQMQFDYLYHKVRKYRRPFKK